MVRICFQIEQAHWYYIDFCRQEDPDLKPCGMKQFMSESIFSNESHNVSEDVSLIKLTMGLYFG